ncbi:MAG: hypothetical protein QM756_40015 [Polyangiaceae bacterium]
MVEGYSAPYNFRRLEALHSEWSPGKLDARLVVYDLETRAVLCIAPVHVRGDATGAPLSRRLRESTRNDLTRKLHGRALSEMGVALSGMSRVLRLPETEPLLVSRRDGV